MNKAKLAVIGRTSEGVELAYVLDGALKRDGSNLIPITGIHKSKIISNLGDTVYVSIKKAYPKMVGNKYGLNFEGIEVLEKATGKANSSKELFNILQDSKCLEVDETLKSPLEELNLIKKIEELKAQIKDIPFDKRFNLIKLDDEKHYVASVVYEPLAVDAHGDYATAEEIEKACDQFGEDFMGKGRDVSLMHEARLSGQAHVTQSWISPVDYDTPEGKVVKGSWVMKMHIVSPELWKAIESGEIDAFSIEGTGQPGPDIKESELRKSEGGQVSTIQKRNLCNMVINAIALVDKGANKRKFYLKKRYNPMEKSLAIACIKGSQDAKLWKSIAESVSEEDKPEVEKAITEQTKPSEKKPACNPLEARIKAIEAALNMPAPKEKVIETDKAVDEGHQEEELSELEDLKQQLQAMIERVAALEVGEESENDTEKALEFETNKPGSEYGDNDLKEKPETTNAGDLGPGKAPEIKKYLENPNLEIPEHLIAKVIENLN